VVDLDFFGQPGYCHVSFLDRVCTAAEAECIRRSARPSTSLAAVWAAKEAAYKLMAKQSGAVHFVPRQFIVQCDESVLWSPATDLTVTHCGTEARVSIASTERWVHATVTDACDTEVRWSVCETKRLSRRGNESEAVRSLAAHLLCDFAQGNSRLEFVGRVPVAVGKDGRSANLDISLSHHGAFAAAAIAWHSAPPAPIAEGQCDQASRSEDVCSICTA
jgi:phosphopantetheinyl transferase (holo-ACP synthase)